MPVPTPQKSVQFLKGIGPRRAELLAKLGILTVDDLLFHFPRDYQDRSEVVPIHGARPGEKATVVGVVASVGIRNPHRGRVRLIVDVEIVDHTGRMGLTFFNQPYVADIVRPDQRLLCHGKVSLYRRKLQMASPQFENLGDEEVDELPPIVPIYPLTEGIYQATLRRAAIQAIAEDLPQLPETIPEKIRKRRGLLSRREAIRILHFPPVDKRKSLLKAARRTIVFEDFFLLELSLVARRRLRQKEPPKLRSGNETIVLPGLRKQFFENLPFEPTNAQKRVMKEIEVDLEKPVAMERLLQGDVGSGKTLVIISALLWAAARGLQGAFMAPTEVLAEQHYRTLERWLTPLGVSTSLLTGGTKPRTTGRTLFDVSDKRPDIIVGTHALFYDRAEFDNLGIAVIDEQHKFGVMQRERLLAKGTHPHLLITSATPIPRTLALTVYGDLDVSVIDEMPPGRKDVVTRWTRWEKEKEVYKFLRERVLVGRQLYIVCPLIEESENLPHLAAVEERFPAYRDKIFQGVPCALLHGRMSHEEKEATMLSFERGETIVLVSTTVIEVGIDVPNANLMLIENAERFGLSQLHQLRGRIARSSRRSYCILMTGDQLTDTAKRRMKAMQETSDGFIIAEEDLAIRGPGELLGTRQSGALRFRLADLIADQDILMEARDEAFRLTDENPRLEGTEMEGLRETLADQTAWTA
jgi:ATP-dependent DNA helicase RecG